MGKQRTPKQILDGAGNLVSQVNSLLVSTANPSDDTSLSIRLSMVKVRKNYIFFTNFNEIPKFYEVSYRPAGRFVLQPRTWLVGLNGPK